jgi:pyruvate/2-oxoglutarate/acetoin dehydrogenase E1 component
MTQAAGMYNTLLAAQEPALVVECLNGYRSKEPMPTNIGEFRIPLGVPEIVREGRDITLVSYGSTIHICLQAAQMLAESGVQAEVIDVRTLLPFDRHHSIVESLKKTNRILFVDEDVPGGATAFMLNEVINVQGGYRHLDAQPQTLSAQPHLPAQHGLFNGFQLGESWMDGVFWSNPGILFGTETVQHRLVLYRQLRYLG